MHNVPYGMRAIPLVGRDDERDALWNMLRDATERGRASLAVVSGPTGSGKSALVRWLAATCRELGAAQVFEGSRESGGLAGMLWRHFRGQDADRAELVSLVRRALSQVEENAVSDNANDESSRDAHVNALVAAMGVQSVTQALVHTKLFWLGMRAPSVQRVFPKNSKLFPTERKPSKQSPNNCSRTRT